MEVYHYTSEESLELIRLHGYIRESPLSDKDAFFGAGVYLTTRHPREGRRRIAHNNWGHAGPYMEDQGKTDRAIKLWIPQARLRKAQSGDRDIWIHKGNIVLSDYPHTFLRLDQGSWVSWFWSWCSIL